MWMPDSLSQQVFPGPSKKGIGGDKEAVKEDCSNKTGAQERGEMWREEGQERGIQGCRKRKHLIEGWWREVGDALGMKECMMEGWESK